MTDEQRLEGIVRGPSPCKDCEERFPACSGRCPKDLRGEYGYNAWKDYLEQVKQAKKAYIESRQDDGKRRDRWVIRR